MSHLDESIWAAVIAQADTELAPPASADAVTKFEADYRVVLPAAHRAFLQRGNGGIVGYVRLFGVGRSDGLDLGTEVVEMRPYIEGLANGLILPFANDWGGSYFCYDLQHRDDKGDYPVLLWDHEYSEEPDDRPMLWSTFAADFVSFLKEIIGEARS